MWDRAETLTIRGYGFKSTASGEGEIDFVRIDDGTGAAVSFGAGTTVKNGDATAVAIEVISDTQAVIPINVVGSEVDGTTRYVRVARKNTGATIAIRNASLSVTNGLIPISGITTKPELRWFTRTSDSPGISMPFNGPGEDNYSAAYFRRDRAITITGRALNTATHILDPRCPDKNTAHGKGLTIGCDIQLINKGIDLAPISVTLYLYVKKVQCLHSIIINFGGHEYHTCAGTESRPVNGKFQQSIMHINLIDEFSHGGGFPTGDDEAMALFKVTRHSHIHSLDIQLLKNSQMLGICSLQSEDANFLHYQPRSCIR